MGLVPPNRLECAAIFGHQPLTIRWRLGVYTKAMMIKRILTICAAVAAGAATMPLVRAQQVYPAAPGSFYSPAPQPYALGTAPNFDATDEDEWQDSAPLPPPGTLSPQGPVMSPDDPRYGRPLYSDRNLPPGPVMSPDDPRYGRPAVTPPVYSERGNVPTGPVLSPDDPRYGRPAGPPAVIYADRPQDAQQASVDPNAPRPPGAIGAPPNVAGSVQQAPTGVDAKSMTIASLPPEEQPETAPAQLPPNLRRQEVSFVTKEPPGTIVVDTPNTYLYYVLGNGRAIRYGVRVGRDGFTWTGVQKVTRKKEWPDWFPPTEMIERQPYLPRFMAGGPGNPLGARAMYLGNTVYRIHGTNQPSTIGKFVSSGCIGMLNEDVSDLFDRVKVGTRVVVLPGGAPAAAATASSQPAPNQVTAQQSAQQQPPMQMMSNAPGTSPTVVPPLPAPVTIR
jgi:lipoprotein-anchoring transpeptidase ErfK/SrfK